MSAVLGGVLLAVRVAAVLLGAVALLAAVLLLLPVGLDIRWDRKNDLAVKFCAGPLRFPVYPRPKKKAAKAKAKEKAKPKAKTKPERKAASPEPGPPPAPPAQNKDEDAGVAAPQPDTAQQGPAAAAAPAPAAQPDAGGLLGAARTLAAALWPRRQAFLNRIRVRHLNIFWTVTGADAADTAITYGRRIAACNMALAAARDHIRIQADRLRLEPDFTGKQKEKRCISCQILCRTYIMLIVLKALLQRNEKTGEVPLRKALEQLGAE